MKATKRSDVVLLALAAALVVVGFVVFISASLGLLARGGVSISSIAFNHVGLGIGLGVVLLLIVSRINYRIWRTWSIHLFVAALVATGLVFIPGLGLEHGGAQRWLLLGPISVQPAEGLKLATIIMLASYLATYRTQLQTLKYGIGLFSLILIGPALLLLLQPDTGTLGIVGLSAAAMFIAAGAKWRDVGILAVAALMLLAALAFMRPYVLDRVMTFVNPVSDPQGSSYQIQQSLIAIGSGGVVGRGFGQSVQKFSYLPEPMSDSIFAVAAEEFGFIGSIAIIGLFFGFAARGFYIAARAPDYFGAMLAVGITVFLVGQAFLNIAAMLGLAPLTGIPLVFISQGGTAMLIALTSVGILLNISRFIKKN